MAVYQLNLKNMLERANLFFAKKEIISRETDGSLHRYTYGDYYRRVCRLANALKRLGIKRGDRVATFAWNTYRHFELYFGVTCYGAVLHTVNIRLSVEHIAYILNHAEDKVVFLDPDLLPVMEEVAPHLKTVKHFIILSDHVPETTLPSASSYEQLLAQEADSYEFPTLDENSPAGMCYTSATTGNPKGVVYTHRSIYLHTSHLCFVDSLAIEEKDVLLPFVPMFHVNAWGIPFAGAWMGSTMVFPGVHPTAEDLARLIQETKVTFAAAAVTVGIDMLKVLQQQPYDISSLRALMLGGQATPEAVIQAYQHLYGVPIFTAWGATECSPIATTVHIKSYQQQLSLDEKMKIRARQGLLSPGLEMKILDEQNQPVPWDDRHMGEIYVRGPWIATEYYQDERTKESFVDGWWKSGDIATINEEGIIKLVDRAKDLIKSGGEWISSVDLENALMAHPAVQEATVVAVPHEKWQERPVACVVLKPGEQVSEEVLRAWLAAKFPKWWLPDKFIFMDQIPKTGVGKFNKKALREMLKNTG